MDKFIECEKCGFVLLADDASKPKPKRVESCPGCDGTNFAFTDG